MNKKPFNSFGYFLITSPAPVRFVQFPALLILFLSFHSTSIFAQKIAVIVPDKSTQSLEFASRISLELASKFLIIDSSLSGFLFQSQKFERSFNLSTEDSKKFGSIAGCNFFVLIKSETLRRTSFERDRYFESYASIHLVSARTGKLVNWAFVKFEEDSERESRSRLFDSIEQAANSIALKIDSSEKEETILEYSNVPELDENLDYARDGFRPPLPYRRLKPAYTDIASLYDILATVDIAVTVDAEGNVTDTQILRWAGYGLDESVIETVKKMKWRPADENGRTMAMQVLLRYNFKNIVTDN